MLKRHSVDSRRFWDRSTIIGLPILLITLLLCLLAFSDRAAAMTLTAPAGPGSIGGRVTDEAGVGLAGIEVVLERIAPTVSAPHRLTASDGAGVYSFGALGIGTYRVKFTDPTAYYGTLYYGAVGVPRDALTITLNGNMVMDVNVALPRTAAVNGTVRSEIPTILHDIFVMQQSRDGTFETVATLLYENLLEGSIAYAVGGLSPGNYQFCTFVDPFPMELNRCYGSVFGDHSPSTLTIDAGVQVANLPIVLDDYTQGTALAGVVKEEAGELLSGIQVTLWAQINETWIEQSRVLTDHLGRYYFGHRSPGTYTLAFHDLTGTYITEYYGDVAVRHEAVLIALVAGQRATDLVTTLSLASQIVGTIFIQDGIPPLYADLTLYIENGDTWTIFSYAHSDAKTGAFHFAGLRSGRYRLKIVSDLGYGQITRYYGGDALADAQDIMLDAAEIRHDLTILLGADEYNSVIGGVVRDGTNPLAGIAVQLLAGGYEYFAIADGVTDADGRYQFNNLLSGKYTVLFADPQGIFATSYFDDQRTWPTASRIALLPSQVITDADMTLARGGTIRGVIRNGTGRPLTDTQVSVSWRSDGIWNSDMSLMVTTNDQGIYALRGLLPGTYRLAAMHPAYVLYFWEYYGSEQGIDQATDLVIERGANLTGIDIILGPDHLVWLPLLAR